jgi:outer membrane autotransporter protein
MFASVAFASSVAAQERKDVVGVVIGTGSLCLPIKLPFEQLALERLPIDLPQLPTDKPSSSCPNTLAPLALAVQAGTAVVATGSFTGSIFARLDGIHQQGALLGAVAGDLASAGGDGMMALGYRSKAREKQSPAVPQFTSYAMGTFAGGNRPESATMAGFNYEAASGTAGFEYSVSRNFIVGFAANYTSTRGDVNTGASVDVDAVQAAAYASYATRHWFADVLAAYGHHDLDLARPGVNDVIRGSTDANAVALAARGGYLFDFGRLRAGPIAGLTYIHSKVGGYTEQGDPQLTLNVSAMTVDALTGNLGIRFLAPFEYGGRFFVPYLNVTVEHQFGDNTQTLSASLTQAPLAPVLTPVPSFDTRTYGKIDGGLTIQLGPQTAATISASSTFAREDGVDYRVSAGLNYRF